MVCFDCNGWLHIKFCDNDEIANIKFIHLEDHVIYYKIDIPPEVKQLVQEHPDLKMDELWNRILKLHPTPSFTRKAVYEILAAIDRKKWQRDADELKSARILLEELSRAAAEGALANIETIFIGEEPGHTALSFAFPTHLNDWASKIRELTMDSAWNTNGSSYELFALLGETYGKGLPLAYLLVRSDGTGPQGAKERLLKSFLKHIKTNWKIRPIVTLTDKDASEIAACREVFPEAAHLLCFWHALRAFKTRLSILRRAPAFYNVDEAIAEFPWIDRSFVPVKQLGRPLVSNRVRVYYALLTLSPGRARELRCYPHDPRDQDSLQWRGPKCSHPRAHTAHHSNQASWRSD
ncbi:hypothetical protein SCHPADRAFT_819783 [Schizopora paradoxa]|uniref:MULE transposase domain-containing protein n=1 Tax=Schizopora paradoxa TaxID=27342 RepID=A0A0H2S3C4_9AGAM|nr:hypothetical protein SCHPADRAFT_819783 [Schizopora paradoxa]